MRFSLLYNPRVLCERLAIESHRRRRLNNIKGTVASNLNLGHLDSLEFFEIIRSAQPAAIYDIGANVGTWSLLAKAFFPNAKIHAFEPLEEHHDSFNHRCGAFENIYLHDVALGPDFSTSNMHVTNFTDASSLLELADLGVRNFNIAEERLHQVTVVPLDDYVKKNKLPLPDLIKLDIQGYEIEALRGGEECLNHAEHIISEVSFLEFYRGQALFHDVVEFLHKRRFNLCALSVTTPLGKMLSQTDALFVRDHSSQKNA